MFPELSERPGHLLGIRESGTLAWATVAATALAFDPATMPSTSVSSSAQDSISECLATEIAFTWTASEREDIGSLEGEVLSSQGRVFFRICAT